MIEKIIERSIQGNIPLVIIYQKQDSITQRLIRPRSLVKGILKAWDYEKQGPRTFRMDKILAAEIRRKDITKKGAPAED
ncbi:MAG: hypothetical protein ACOX6S_09895 [Clostridia bacterium]|jgi:predicted DNA-binding transcriptional regulator YafY